MDINKLWLRYQALGMNKQNEVLPRLFGWHESMLFNEYSSQADKEKAGAFFEGLNGVMNRMEADK